ncbi:hypothetical protein GCK72_006927 [Caenorhabditis remanei]|uniref:F-box domain-containing protein n=1 Tax=Caenorhabditis remanei TaxID=31234 RepID=A0A6A5HHW1_CAERE|nr:hypothetical protein GCK72_006927 [Caenorhabditis remanei]KAF1766969.1 hypothetical protein GCK72_006927 [Caenorhabditis remanei]
MRFLKFPFLVHLNIQKYLEPSELLLLSFCSLRTRALVSSMRHAPTYSVFVLDRPEVMYYSLVNLPEKEKTVIIWTWKSEQMENVKTERVKSKYIDLGCRITFNKNSNTPILWCSFEDGPSRKRFATALHSHMCEVFRVEPEMQFKLSLEYMNDLPYTNTVRDVTLLDTFVNYEVVDEFFKKFHVKRAVVSLSFKDSPLKGSFQLLQVNNVIMKSAFWLKRSQFLKFDCENLVTGPSELKKRDLVAFVKQWLKGNNTKLKTLHVLSTYCVDVHTIMNKFDLSRWDPQVDKVEYNEPIYDYANQIVLTQHYLKLGQNGIVRRKSDGLRALATTFDGQFHFHVFHNEFELK